MDDNKDRLEVMRNVARKLAAKDRADAARYRYLRDNHMREWVSDMPHNKGAPSLDLDFSAEGHDLDAAIDRAMGSPPNAGLSGHGPKEPK